MQVTNNPISELSTIVKISISQDDYRDGVEKNLKIYRKKANIPGFRKGMVPMNLIKKQYEKAFVVDEVTNLVQNSINDYINDNKLELLGQPLPKDQDLVDWEAKEIEFEFELGIQPKFDFNFDSLDVKKYKIVLSDEEIDKEVNHIREQFSEPVEVEKISKKSWIKSKINHPEIVGENQEVNFSAEDLKENLHNLKKGDSHHANAKEIFEKEDALYYGLKDESKIVWASEQPLVLEIVYITDYKAAELTQELIDKMYGEGKVEGEQGLRNKIREEKESQLEKQTEQFFLNMVLEELLEKTNFALPDQFLVKWLTYSNKEIKNEKQAEEEYHTGYKKSIKYEIIQSRLALDYDIQVLQDDLKKLTLEIISPYMASFPDGKEKDDIYENMYKRMMANQNERERIYQMAFNQKMIKFFNEKLSFDTIEVGYEAFKEMVESEKKVKEEII